MRLRNAVLSAILQQNATVLISFGSWIVIARLLTPQQVGAYSVAMGALNVAFALKDSGLSSYVVSNAKHDEVLLRSAFGLTLAISVGLVAGFVALSWPIAVFYRDPALGHVLRVVALGQIPSALAFPATIELTRALRFDILLVVGLAGAACQSAASIALAYAGAGAVALGWGYLLGTIVTAVAAIAARPAMIRLCPSFAQARQLVSFGGWMSATMLAWTAGAALPQLMVGRALSLSDAGLFSRAQSVVAIIRGGLSDAVMRPMLPRFSEYEHDGSGMSGISLRVVESVTGLAWPAYAMLVVWAEPLIRVLYGPAWSAATPLILPLAIAHGVALAVAPFWEVLIVKRRGRLLFLCEASSFVVLAVVLGAGLLRGLEEGLWGMALAQLLFVTPYVAVLKSLIGFSAGALFAAWARSLALTLAVILPALLFRFIDARSPTGVLIEMIACSAISALLWLICIRITSHELCYHVNSIISALFSTIASRRAAARAPSWLSRLK